MRELPRGFSFSQQSYCKLEMLREETMKVHIVNRQELPQKTAEIVQADSLVLIATGDTQADTVATLLEGRTPALLPRRDLTVLLDFEAAACLGLCKSTP
jgi:hypothetical protein